MVGCREAGLVLRLAEQFAELPYVALVHEMHLTRLGLQAAGASTKTADVERAVVARLAGRRMDHAA